MSCPNLKTYNEVRMEKLEKINAYHTTELLGKYAQFTGISDNDTVMKQKYKQQLDKLNKQMLDILDNDVQLLLEQHQELETKTAEVQRNKEVLIELKKNIEKERVSRDARVENVNEMSLMEKDNKFYHNVYLYANIMIFIILIASIAYVYLKK
jgi:hypothetical protein